MNGGSGEKGEKYDDRHRGLIEVSFKKEGRKGLIKKEKGKAEGWRK